LSGKIEMRVRVLDASALGALVFGQPRAGEFAEVIGDAPMVAAALLWFELASICLEKMKAHPAQKDRILRAFDLASPLAIQIVQVDHSAVIELARETGLTTYDASYLWLAQHLQGELITLDEMLQGKVAQ
jgi:predicted nucleic acid-binding protein